MSTLFSVWDPEKRRDRCIAGGYKPIREAPWSSGKALALDAARPRSIPGLGGENY